MYKKQSRQPPPKTKTKTTANIFRQYENIKSFYLGCCICLLIWARRPLSRVLLACVAMLLFSDSCTFNNKWLFAHTHLRMNPHKIFWHATKNIHQCDERAKDRLTHSRRTKCCDSIIFILIQCCYWFLQSRANHFDWFGVYLFLNFVILIRSLFICNEWRVMKKI